MDADPQHQPLRRRIGAGSDTALDVDGAGDRLYGAPEFRQDAVAGGLEDAAAMLGDRRIDLAVTQSGERRHGGGLVRFGKARKADHAGGRYRQTSLRLVRHRLFPRGNALPANARQYAVAVTERGLAEPRTAPGMRPGRPSVPAPSLSVRFSAAQRQSCGGASDPADPVGLGAELLAAEQPRRRLGCVGALEMATQGDPLAVPPERPEIVVAAVAPAPFFDHHFERHKSPPDRRRMRFSAMIGAAQTSAGGTDDCGFSRRR
jgi:hypothetical protein